MKTYGTKKAIEGCYQPGQTVLIVEDLVTSGLSVFETVEALEAEGLMVQDIVVLLDRGQGGRRNIEARGKRLHAVLTLEQAVIILHEQRLVERQTMQDVIAFLAANQVDLDASLTPSLAPVASQASFAERAKVAPSALGRRLFSLMERKQSNLCVAVDVTTSAELLQLTEAVGPHVCMIKTHCDLVGDWSAETAAKLVSLGKTYGFVIFEDRKFADIGNTVVEQCRGGLHRISSWANFVNAHSLPGPGIIAGLQKAYEGSDGGGLLLLAQMSSEGSMCTAEYTARTVQMAEANDTFVFGFISQGRLRPHVPVDPFIYMTPGVQLQPGGDSLGQVYNTPEHVLGTKGSDVIIVGRAICTYEKLN